MKNKEVNLNIPVDEIIVLIILISFAICGIIFCYNYTKKENETDCLYYYENHGYILDSCKCYENKLKQVKVKEKDDKEIAE